MRGPGKHGSIAFSWLELVKLREPSVSGMTGRPTGWRLALECRGVEGVALPEVTGLEPAPEPAQALFRCPVCERIGCDHVARLALEPVVADGGGRVQGFFEIPRLEDLLARLSVMRPDAGEEIGLQLEPHGQTIELFPGHPATHGLDLVADPQQVLDVMPDLVGDDVGLGEVSRSPKATAEFVEEIQVEVDLAIARTVEGSDRGARLPAGRFDPPREQDELGLAILLALLAEQLVPDILGVLEHHRDEVLELLLLGARDRGFLTGRQRHLRAGTHGQQLGRIPAHEQEHHDQDESADAAPDREPPAPHSTAVLDVVTTLTTPPAHAALLPRRRVGIVVLHPGGFHRSSSADRQAVLRSSRVLPGVPRRYRSGFPPARCRNSDNSRPPLCLAVFDELARIPGLPREQGPWRRDPPRPLHLRRL